MSLKEQLAQDLKESMKNKQTVRKNTVQMVRTAILQKEKDDRVTLDDGDILEVISKQLKQRKDALPEYEKSGREDLISQLKEEMDVLMGYLPKQLTPDELRPIVEAAVKETGATGMRDMGKVMAAVMPQVKGRADGKAVNAIAKELFGN
ncbi:MAG: GatB/YqeY domain-containing protein [Clostridia bacterium]|nr:GatB/YqeY domain-containing protein [Clostridia bacterium]MBQ3461582.1 GatB/YqeY domain-containing protein [Clostridia bacterium]MBQ3471860.1 GatB/YqeY domain-containing protein [Clostridia bacterium]MBQ6530001.1 GatB/YqeY domain-containing protein [Clostridia bacterium]MBQ6558329.1 GatB/YqeY domain-containing protein [Clostridia bacterium]